jgi:hypothetical protein
MNLKGMLKLGGMLKLKNGAGGEVTIENKGILVELTPGTMPPHAMAPPVIMPPPPAGPSDPGPQVVVINSFNKTVMIATAKGDKPIVARGMVMQGATPSWPGMVMPGKSQVMVNNIPANTITDMATIFPNGGSATFNMSGQL